MPAGGNSRFRGYPARMSERQQLALLLQMTSQEIVPSGVTRSENLSNQSTPRSSSLVHQRGSKSRWSTKAGESPTYRKEDYSRRSMIFNGYEIDKESHEAREANPSEETSSPDSPRSPSSETGTGAPPIVRQDQHDIQNYQHSKVYQYQRPTGTTSAGNKQDAEDSGDLCEMRRTPPQNKVDRSGSGTGSSPRVTLRLNQVRGVRDDKKSGSSSRQSMSGANQGQMETAKSTASTVQGSSSTTTTTTAGVTSTPSGITSSAGTPAVDNSDVYEFKSSKEATPVRGASSSPNPPEKERDGSKTNSGASQAEAPPSTSESTPATAGGAGATEGASVGSPGAKRPYDGTEDEQDEENRRKKKKDSEGSKDAKGPASGRATTGRAAVGATDKSDKLASVVTASSIVEQCPKTGKQGAVPPGKPQQSSTPADRKSPSSISASSPKPLATPPTKTSTPAPESDSEEDRPKSSDSSSAPKVPPLKIVIPQTTEQEQTRNGKNPSTRGHQLPYVVASSNSNDSTDKDQTQSTSGTTSPIEASGSSKSDEKKDFSGAIHNEERSIHHQRVLRSAHRGNGNGSTNSKDLSNQSGNGSYSNSSPLPATDRSNNSSPQPPASEGPAESTKSSSEPAPAAPKATSNSEKAEKSEGNVKTTKESSEGSENSSGSSNASASVSTAAPVELHPRKRKMKPSKEAQQAVAASNEASETANAGTEVHPHDQPITNCYQLFLNIRKQIERRRKGLFPVQPKPPQGFKDYLMNRCTYVLAGNASKEPNINPPGSLQGPMKELYIEQEKERYRLRMQHVVEKEKLVLSVEQEILRVHGRAARALANQILPFSVCTILKDEEVYNVITPEQEEKDRNQRSRYNGRLFLSWLQDIDDKWEKIKEAMLLRHHNEAESLHAVQRMDWEWKLKEVGLCEFKATPQIDDLHVPIVHVSDDFDLLPA